MWFFSSTIFCPFIFLYTAETLSRPCNYRRLAQIRRGRRITYQNKGEDKVLQDLAERLNSCQNQCNGPWEHQRLATKDIVQLALILGICDQGEHSELDTGSNLLKEPHECDSDKVGKPLVLELNLGWHYGDQLIITWVPEIWPESKVLIMGRSSYPWRAHKQP